MVFSYLSPYIIDTNTWGKWNRYKTWFVFFIGTEFFCYFLSFQDHLSYVPGKDRERPYQLEMILTTIESFSISFQFEMGFLKWNEFPPDPNHGFYIPSAVISTNLRRSKSTDILRSLNSFSLNQR